MVRAALTKAVVGTLASINVDRQHPFPLNKQRAISKRTQGRHHVSSPARTQVTVVQPAPGRSLS
jgi:hypothetical protein